MLVLREDDVRAILTMPDTIAVLEAAFRRQGEDATRNQPRRRVVLPDGRGVLHTMSAFVPGEPGRPEADGPGLLGLKTTRPSRKACASLCCSTPPQMARHWR